MFHLLPSFPLLEIKRRSWLWYYKRKWANFSFQLEKMSKAPTLLHLDFCGGEFEQCRCIFRIKIRLQKLVKNQNYSPSVSKKSKEFKNRYSPCVHKAEKLWPMNLENGTFKTRETLQLGKQWHQDYSYYCQLNDSENNERKFKNRQSTNNTLSKFFTRWSTFF